MGKGSGVWKPSPGRQLPHTLHIGEKMVGLLLLSSCVLNLKERDQYLQLPTDPSERGTALRQYMDLAVAIGAQTISYYWNIGKLIALLAPTLVDEFQTKYRDELLGVTTTSLWGKSSQYNRIYKFLGYTGGHGVMHIPLAERTRMKEWVKRHAPEYYTSLKEARRGSMDIINVYISQSGDKTWSTFHGNKRGIYYHPAVPTEERSNVIQQWYERWGLPRWQRMKDEPSPYPDGTTWHKEQLTPEG